MRGLVLIGFIVAAWLVIRNWMNSSQPAVAASSPGNLLPPDPAQPKAPDNSLLYMEGQPYNNSDATTYSSADGLVTGNAFDPIEAYDNYLFYGIEAPLAPARPNGG